MIATVRVVGPFRLFGSTNLPPFCLGSDEAHLHECSKEDAKGAQNMQNPCLVKRLGFALPGSCFANVTIKEQYCYKLSRVVARQDKGPAAMWDGCGALFRFLAG